MNKFSSLGLLLAIALSSTVDMSGCTGLKLLTQDGNAVHGRTLEFGETIDSSVAFIPRNYPFTATTPLGPGLAYKSKYAVLGTITFDTLLVMDGMNEKGLSVGTFYFPGFAEYTPTTKDNQLNSLSPLDFPNWILTQFADLQGVIANLPSIFIAPTVNKSWGEQAAPFHFIVYDREGNSIVIEPIAGQLAVTNNPLGTLTNSPTFDWHMTNLRNYINLSPKNVEPLTAMGVTLKPFGQGSGLVGLPGDFTPPSRFVRASLYAMTAEKPANVDEGVFQAFHILNQFDIPVGSIQQAGQNGVIHNDYTQATVVHDPVNLKYYFRTYKNQDIKVADLNAFDKSGQKILKISTDGREKYTDISKELK